MNPALEIFSQGEEIVTGQTVDTNAAWLSEQAVQLGFTVTRHTAVGDKLGDLIALLKEISERADCCLCTGGLGPTSDDLTNEAVAEAFNRPLRFDETAFAQIRQYFSARNRPMPETNRKQAMLPEGSLRLDNEWGTAPGFALQAGRCWFAFMPGVPSEMRHIFQARIRPELSRRFVLTPAKLVTIKTLGIGESDLQQRLDCIAIPGKVQLGFRAGVDDVQTKLLFPSDYPEPAMAELVNRIAKEIGDTVFGIDGLNQATGDLVSVVDRLMQAAGKTLFVAETASQGLMAAKCIGSDWLRGSIFEPSIAKLGKKLGVEIEGDDLPETAKRLASALKKMHDSDCVLIQLYNGSANSFQDKDKAIILYNTLLTETGFHQAAHSIAGPIKRKQNQAALLALDLLRRYLQH